MKALGVVDLALVQLGVGYSILYGLGLVRSARAAAAYGGLALVSGWAALGTLTSLALMVGTSAGLWLVLSIAVATATVCALAARRVPGASHARLWQPTVVSWIVGLGAATIALASLGMLLRRTLVSHPAAWDAWAFWVPKAQAIVWRGGLGTGPGSVSSFANPDYPPLVPAVDSLAFRFADAVDPSLLPVAHWLLAVGALVAIGRLLWDRVAPQLLVPGLAVVSLLPAYADDTIGSLLGDESLAISLALVGVTGALWLVGRDPRHLALLGLFATAMALTKNEGATYAILIAVFIVVEGGLRRRWITLAASAAPLGVILAWKLWLTVHDIPPTANYRLSDLLRPGYLLDRIARLETALSDVPGYYLGFERWRLVLPAALLLAGLAARFRPRLALFVGAVLGVGFLGNLAVYWISPAPVEWYIATSAARTSVAPVVFAAALLPLLAAEASRRREPVEA